MLDVHPPEHAAHTWRDFLIHIATITVGLLIAVGLEQTVEVLNRRHEAAALREDLHAESEQILSDSRKEVVLQLYRQQWFQTRMTQVKAAYWSHLPLAAVEPYREPYAASPDIPIWRAAKASAQAPLLSKGEVNAFSEVEYVQSNVQHLEAALTQSRDALNRFTTELPTSPDGMPDFTDLPRTDLRLYLDLLSAVEAANSTVLVWTRILVGAELAVLDGKTKLQDLYDSEIAANTGKSQ
jgi:hypothetical protein